MFISKHESSNRNYRVRKSDRRGKKSKTESCKAQDYLEARKLKDEEERLQIELNLAQENWDKEVKEKKEVVTEENVAEVVSMMSGVPVTKVGKTSWINYPRWMLCLTVKLSVRKMPFARL